MKYVAQEPPTDVGRLPEYLSGETRRLESVLRFTVADAISASSSSSYAGILVKSQPPAGSYRVLNLYLNSDRQLVVIYG